MTVFQGSYADLKFIKTRSVAAITIEIPIETAAAFVAAFGAPTPGSECPVAIARLNPAKGASEAPKPTDEPKPARQFNELPLSQQAALRCQDQDFRAFLRITYPAGYVGGNGNIYPAPNNAEEAATLVRNHCGVASRADILTRTQPGNKWLFLESAFQAWRGHV